MANNGMKTLNIDGNNNALARPCLVSRLLSIPVTLTAVSSDLYGYRGEDFPNLPKLDWDYRLNTILAHATIGYSSEETTFVNTSIPSMPGKWMSKVEMAYEESKSESGLGGRTSSDVLPTEGNDTS